MPQTNQMPAQIVAIKYEATPKLIYAKAIIYLKSLTQNHAILLGWEENCSTKRLGFAELNLVPVALKQVGYKYVHLFRLE